jgi:hypothetical protein
MKNLLLLLLYSSICLAEGDGSGKITFENRFFNDDSNINTQDQNNGLFLDFSHKMTYKNWIVQGKVVARIDKKDQTRDYLDLNEAYGGYEGEFFSIFVGSQIQNWSALEVFHPIDIFNPVNLDADFESREKLGQPSINVNFLFGNNQLSLFYMPLFVAPRLPFGRTRLGFFTPAQQAQIGEPLLVKGSQSREDRKVSQFAVKLDFSFDSFDTSFYYMHIYDTSFVAVSTTQLGTDQRPTYVMTDQFGMTIQYPVADFNFKYEGLYKKYDTNSTFGDHGFYFSDGPDNYMVNALGIEYNYNFEIGHDLTLLGEYQRFQSDSVDNVDDLGFFQNDVFFAIRYAFNNINSSEVFLSLLNDLKRSETVVAASYSQRITDYWYLKSGFRSISATESDAKGLSNLDNLQEYKVNLERRF